LIAAAALLARAGPTAAVCMGAPNASAADYLRDEQLHRALRTEMNVPVPIGPVRVMIFAAGGHLATTRISVIAVRGAGGQWNTDAEGRDQVWIEGAPPHDWAPIRSALPLDTGRQVDAFSTTLDCDASGWLQKDRRRAATRSISKDDRRHDADVYPSCGRDGTGPNQNCSRNLSRS